MNDASPTTNENNLVSGRSGVPQFVGFLIAGQHYLFRIEKIQEIIMPAAVAGVPEVPSYVEGVSNLRGTIIPIINLRSLFGLDHREADVETRTIVVNVGSRTLGCTVDAVSRVMRIPPDQIQPAAEAAATTARFVEGFAHVDEDLLILLDVEQLLDPARLDEVHRASIRMPPTTA